MKQFHGYRKHHSFFEGWYFKHQKQDLSLAVIPAFHIDREGNMEASIQIITGEISDCVTFPSTDFYAETKQLSVSIGPNDFSAHGITLNLRSEHFRIKGRIAYGPLTPLQSDIMGPFRFLPFMQCHHGVVSLSHSLTGVLEVNGRLLDFTDGIGYIEKDWGTSFPQSYLWTQCTWANPYNSQPCSIMVSLAHIPFGPWSFTGCIAVVYYGMTEYRLATYRRVKILEYTKRDIILRQGNYTLHVHLVKDAPQPLNAPVTGEMTRTIHESLSCKVHYQFFIHQKKVMDILSTNASFEHSAPKPTRSSRP